MKVTIAIMALLASVTALGAIPVNDSRPVLRGGFSAWAQAQQQPTGYCECLDSNTRGISCKLVTSCIPLGECLRVCPKPI